MSGNREEILRQFCDVTGVDETRSRFFLESSNWQLEIALSSFYEHGGNVDEAPVNPSSGASRLPYLSGSDMDSPPGSPVQPQKKEKKKSGNSKFATLDTLQQDSSSDEDEETLFGWVKNRMTSIYQEHFCLDSTCPNKVEKPNCKEENCVETPQQEIERLKREVESLKVENTELKKEIATLIGESDDAGQAFYAGGSERSGQQILGPGKSRKDIVAEMFKSVRERGAVVFEDEPTSTSQRGGTFGGVGYRLGQTSDDHEPVTPNTQAQQQTEERARLVRLHLYREGFTVDNGQIRPYADPENAEFLNCIRRGKIPLELSHGGGEVRVSMEDRRQHDYVPNMQRANPFAGKGHMLGSPTPVTVGGPPSAGSTPTEADRATALQTAQAQVNLDENSPVTTVQFRLSDGRRVTGRFNHVHTVGTLTDYVRTAEPSYAGATLALATAFPTTELTDPNVTLAQANLLNSTVMIRIK